MVYVTVKSSLHKHQIQMCMYKTKQNGWVFYPLYKEHHTNDQLSKGMKEDSSAYNDIKYIIMER